MKRKRGSKNKNLAEVKLHNDDLDVLEQPLSKSHKHFKSVLDKFGTSSKKGVPPTESQNENNKEPSKMKKKGLKRQLNLRKGIKPESDLTDHMKTMDDTLAEQKKKLQLEAKQLYMIDPEPKENAADAWLDRRRILVLCSRGVTHRHRHLVEDIKRLIPHMKAEPKWDKKQCLTDLNEVCELRSCSSCLYFETKRSSELYMWISRTPDGPSVKFQVLNLHTLGETRFQGNCLVASRPLLVFDRSFSTEKPLILIKQMLTSIFNIPMYHPKSQPFYDHVMSFFYLDHKIWFRHFQISPINSQSQNTPKKQTLTEIGPRFVLDPIKIFDESFSGMVIYENPRYISPTMIRQMISKGIGSKYANRAAAKTNRKMTLKSNVAPKDPINAAKILLSTTKEFK